MRFPHFSELVFIQAKKYGNRNAMFYKDAASSSWEGISWNSFANQIKSVAKSLYDLGCRSKENIAIFSNNKPEGFVADFAAFAIRAVTVPIFLSSTEKQVEFILKDAKITVIFVGNQQQYDIAYDIMLSAGILKKIIVFDNSVKIEDDERVIYYSDFVYQGKISNSHFEVQDCQSKASIDEMASILYTSGTTGDPKGAVLTHENYLEALRLNDIRLHAVNKKDKSVCFLPVSHVLERTWSYYCLAKGAAIYVNENPNDIRQTIKEVRPTLMCSVPRFWEKVYFATLDVVENYNPFMQGVVTWAVATGSKYNIDHIRKGLQPSFWLSINYQLADKFIFSKVKKKIGIENAKILPTAGAALSDDLNIFFRSIGVPLVYGYGLTETTATVSSFPEINYEIGTVGEVIPELEVKIDKADNEILVKGKTVIREYYNNPKANDEAFTKDGFFRTGDVGYLDGRNLILTDRKKDLFKTSNGKYIAPQQIESALASDKYISQVAVIGNNRNFVSALIVPNILELNKLVNKNKIDAESLDKLLKDKIVVDFYMERINELQKNMAGFERIKRIVLLKDAFSIETGELTNTFKLKRSVICHKYKKMIDRMYVDI